MKFCSLYSGSSGNSLFVSNNSTKILIDAGLSGKRIQSALDAIEEDPREIGGIMVTHEHSDHIHGVGVLSRRFDLPVYANEKTWEAMMKDLGKIAEHNIKIFDFEKPFNIQDLQSKPLKHPTMQRILLALSFLTEKTSWESPPIRGLLPWRCAMLYVAVIWWYWSPTTTCRCWKLDHIPSTSNSG